MKNLLFFFIVILVLSGFNCVDYSDQTFTDTSTTDGSETDNEQNDGEFLNNQNNDEIIEYENNIQNRSDRQTELFNNENHVNNYFNDEQNNERESEMYRNDNENLIDAYHDKSVDVNPEDFSTASNLYLTYYASEYSDIIYFGACKNCYNNNGTWEDGLQLCGKKNGSPYNEVKKLLYSTSDYVELTIHGGGLINSQLTENGNNYIEFASNIDPVDGNNVKYCNYPFDSYTLLTTYIDKVTIKGDGVAGGSDRLYGSDGNEYIDGGDGNDFIDGRGGVDYLSGYDGNDHIIGGGGNDHIWGGYNNDYLEGWGGNDYIYAGSGDDYIIGNEGDDHLYGNNDNDHISGGSGNDTIDGGNGYDTFRCRIAVNYDADYDYPDPSSDCTDSLSNIEDNVSQVRDPYLEWAYSSFNNNGITSEYYTTSNNNLLMLERAAGATMFFSSGGVYPMGIAYEDDSKRNDIAIFQSSKREWYYSNKSCSPFSTQAKQWKLVISRPVAGNFDNYNTEDVAVFNPSDKIWYYDYNHNGTTDYQSGPWGNPGDIPIAGNFNCDSVDDVAVFRASENVWYFDLNHNGTTDYHVHTSWTIYGDIPVAGDFDSDGFNDDIGIYNPSEQAWYFVFDPKINNQNYYPNIDELYIGFEDGIPFTGDFDADNKNDDLGLYKISDPENNIYLYNINGEEIDTQCYLNIIKPDEPLHTTHKQYGNTCGPASLNMVFEHFEYTDPNPDSAYPLLSDLSIDYDNNNDNIPDIYIYSYWGSHKIVDVGYWGSMEHIMYVGHWRDAQLDYGYYGENNTLNDSPSQDLGEFYDIRYDIGDVDYNLNNKTWANDSYVQYWLKDDLGVGWHSDDWDQHGLAWVANKMHNGTYDDAHPIDTSLENGSNNNFYSLTHIKLVIKGFIDHGIPLVTVVENGGHFNTLIGYWEQGSNFYIYTADPLEGWGRPWDNKPMRFRKILLTSNTIRESGSSLIAGFMLFAHQNKNGCSGTDDWAYHIDHDSYPDNQILCSY